MSNESDARALAIKIILFLFLFIPFIPGSGKYFDVAYSKKHDTVRIASDICFSYSNSVNPEFKSFSIGPDSLITKRICGTALNKNLD